MKAIIFISKAIFDQSALDPFHLGLAAGSVNLCSAEMRTISATSSNVQLIEQPSFASALNRHAKEAPDTEKGKSPSPSTPQSLPAYWFGAKGKFRRRQP
jgi:hypothetical protein